MIKLDTYNKAGLFVGIAVSLITTLFLVIIFEVVANPFTRFSFANIAIPVTAIVLNGVYFRAVKRDLPLTFAQLLRMGLLITLVSVALFAAFYYAYISMYEGSFFETYRSEAIEMMKTPPMDGQEAPTGETLEKSIAELNKMTAWDIIRQDMMNKLFLGIPTTLFTAIILRK